jgi:hypothetical protein
VRRHEGLPYAVARSAQYLPKIPDRKLINGDLAVCDDRVAVLDRSRTIAFLGIFRSSLVTGTRKTGWCTS